MRLIDADAYKAHIDMVFPCKDRDDNNIRRATEIGLNSTPTVNAIPVPDNATNGDVIKAIFPNAAIVVGRLKGETIDMVHLRNNNMTEASFYQDWWNAPYKRGE